MACLFKCFTNETMLLNKMHQRRRKIEEGKIAATEFNVFCYCNFMVAGVWIFINKTMNVVAFKLTGFACNSFSRTCLVGGHFLFFVFHTIEYIQRLCVQQPMWHDHKAEAAKRYQTFAVLITL